MTDLETDDGIEYYYVTYSCIGVLLAAGVVRQRKVEGREPGDFCIASASQYLYKLLEFPPIIQSWRLISRKRATELNIWANQVTGELESKIQALINGEKVTHLKLVKPPEPPKETPPTGMPPI